MKDENLDQITLFDQYITHQMSESDRLTFEQRLQEDKSLKADFAAFLKSKELLYKAGYQEEKALFEAKRAGLQQRKKRVLQLRTRMMIAAAITILVALAFIFMPSSGPIDSQELFAAYYEAPEVPTTLSPDQDSLLRVADLAFDEKEFTVAHEVYATLNLSDFSAAEKSRIALFQGICALELNEFGDARRYFNDAVQHEEEAQWYSALSWLKEPDGLEQAKAALQGIVEAESHFYGEKAKELLGALE